MSMHPTTFAATQGITTPFGITSLLLGSTTTLQQMGTICILVAIGIYLHRKGIIDSVTSKKLSSIVVDVCNPALIMASILSGNITATHRDLLTAGALGIAFYVIVILLGFLLPHILRANKHDRRFFNLMTVYTNIGFLGIPVAKAILPSNAILYVIVCNVMYCLLFYTHGVTVLEKGAAQKSEASSGSTAAAKTASQSFLSTLKKLLSPGTVMAILSLLIFWYQVTLPPILASTVEYVGNATVFLSMALLGVSIARSNLRDAAQNIRIWGYILIRMILLPICIVLVMNALHFNPDATMTMCLMAAMPVGNLPMIQAEKIGEDTKLLSCAIAVSTAVSIFTITILMTAVFAMLQ